MEDSKMSDKRKAPDKLNESLDLNESSMIELKPARKRPRLQDSVGQDESEVLEVPGGIETVPLVVQEGSDVNQAADYVDSSISPEVSLGGGIDAGFLVKDPQIELPNSEPLELSLPPVENGSSDKEELDQLGKGFVHVEDTDGDDGDNNNGQSQEKKRDAPKFKPENEDVNRFSESNGGEHVSNENGGKRPWSKLPGPIMESSPLTDSEKSDLPSRDVNITIRAYDPITNKLVYEAVCVRSDYVRLEVFLNQHNLGLTSINSGYLGDIDSEGLGPFSVPQPTSGYNRKGRWTSSTLGSSIPRDSIKTVYTISPNGESPDEDEQMTSKKRGKYDPKLASTRLSDDQSLSGRNKGKKEKINGDSNSSTGGFETPTLKPSTPAKRRGSKSSKKSASTTTSTSDTSSANKSNKKRTSATLVDKTVNTPQRTPSTPKSRTVSKEFSRMSGSPLTIPSSATAVEPSPARAVAIVEGTAARPLTKFEQEVNNEPVDLSALKHSKTLYCSVATNNPVFARWSDKNYYSGFIKEKGMNDTWIIDFDDATTYAASEAHIIPIKILGVGITGVYCPDTGYHPADATVLGQKFASDPDIGETVKYAIKLSAGENAGQILWCTRRMLSIKENDARSLRQEFQPTPKTFKAAEVSLENIIPETSRRRVTTSLTKSSTPQSSTPTTARKIVGGAFDASTATEDSHNESNNKQTPKRKPKAKTPRKKSKGNEANVSTLSGYGSKSRGSSMSSSELSSGVEKPLKESPKKAKLAKEKPENQVFSGYQFFLTASGGGDPANTSSNSGPQVPYDKDEYRDLIERKGGKIVDSVGHEEGKEKTFLVSDNYARTVKYIYSLAASIPCVSHKWIQECITVGKIVAWESYELSAGWSLEANKVIPPHKKKPLEGFEIYITAGSNDLYDYWKPVLTAAHAKLLKPKKVKGKIVESDIPKDAQVLVTDSTCSKDILSIAHERMIPVVKPEWLVQSIIAGNRADFFSHEKYRIEETETEDCSEDEYSEDEENQS